MGIVVDDVVELRSFGELNISYFFVTMQCLGVDVIFLIFVLGFVSFF